MSLRDMKVMSRLMQRQMGLDPPLTRAQREALARAFGCARVVFNDALAARRAAHEAGGPYLSDAVMSARLTASRPGRSGRGCRKCRRSCFSRRSRT
jgi:hypothetical protein